MLTNHQNSRTKGGRFGDKDIHGVLYSFDELSPRFVLNRQMILFLFQSENALEGSCSEE